MSHHTHFRHQSQAQVGLQMPVSSPACYLCFWLTCYKSEVPMTPSTGLINLLEWLTELRKSLLTFTGFLWKAIVKDIDDHPGGKDAQGKVCGKGCGASMPSLGTHSHSISMCSPTWKLSKHCTFRKALSRQHDRSLTPFSALLSSQEHGRWGWKFQSYKISLAFLVTSPQPGAHPELPQ